MSDAQTLLTRGMKLSHLQIMVALADTGHVGQAAARLGIAQPAASRLLSEIETILEVAVRERSGRGAVLTEAGRVLAGRAARVMRELGEAAREVGDVAGGGVGRVRIGAVTAPALDIVLPALRQLRQTHPGITCEVVVDSSDMLCGQLASGGLDIVLGRVPPQAERGQFDARVVAPEPVALMVRRGHPLLGPAPVDPAALLSHDWVMPGDESPLARAVLARLAALGLPPPQVHLVTTSFLLTLAALKDADVVAPLAQAVADSFARGPDAPFVQVRTDLAIEVAPFSLLTRAGARLTAATGTLMRLIEARIDSCDTAPRHLSRPDRPGPA
jgi:DNA-binding transcriptional LysR family regulator